MLKLNNVRSGYGKNEIIKGITLEFRESEILALIGLNGSGKSTLLKTILGLLKPMRGEVTLDGEHLRKMALARRSSLISLLESQTPLAFPISVNELLQLAARRHPKEERTRKVEEALVTVGMQNHLNRSVTELSSGEAHRALIAHTLCHNSNIIILDEPFAHLDWRHQKDLAESLKRWNQKYRTTFVMAIHELEWAVQIADRICVLHEGRILALDTPERVFADNTVREVFAFDAVIDENPIDRSRRLTLGRSPR